MTRAAALFSGGKDSVYATYIAEQQCFDIEATLTVVSNRSDSQMFHVPNIMFAPTVSSAIDIPNIMAEVFSGEDELAVLSEIIGSMDVDAIITGAIASDYQLTRIDRICQEHGLRVYSPLWHKSEELLLRDMLKARFRVLIVGAFADGLSAKWLGREVDGEALDALIQISESKGINICGEGGELETFVIDGPNFGKSIELASFRTIWERDSGIIRIDAVRVLDKNDEDSQ